MIIGTLLKRYKRFLADIEIVDGDGNTQVITAHCPNTGSMLGVIEPGIKVWVVKTATKLGWQWRFVQDNAGCMIGIYSALANQIVHQGLLDKQIQPLNQYQTIKKEVKYGQNSRVDFLLQQPALPDYYLEVKSVQMTRSNKNIAEFPDSVTTRGHKHLIDLMNVVADGAKAGMLYLIQRDPTPVKFQIAQDIDPKYYELFQQAQQNNVDIHVYGCVIDQITGEVRINSQF